MKTISPVSYQPTQAQVVTCKTLRSGPKQPTNNTRIGDGKSCSSRVRPWKTKIAMDIGHPPFSLGEYVFKWLSFQVCQCIFSKTNMVRISAPSISLFLGPTKRPRFKPNAGPGPKLAIELAPLCNKGTKISASWHKVMASTSGGLFLKYVFTPWMSLIRWNITIVKPPPGTKKEWRRLKPHHFFWKPYNKTN